MRALIQCVTEAHVQVEQKTVGEIGPGYLIFLGIGQNDSEMEAQKLWNKIYKLRLFMDEQGKTNLSLSAIEGSVLVVSQFTLFADTKKGTRPSFSRAAGAEKGNALYEYFVGLVRKDVPHVETGEFGADMKVSLVNDGPFTIWLDTDDL